LVAKGFSQIEGLDYTETFSPVIKPGSIRTVLSVALMKGWDIRQLDVKNAFLHGHLSELVYMEQPPGFKDIDYPDYVCRLKKALYGLKQALRAWFDRFSGFLLTLRFYCSTVDPSMFVCRNKQGTLILLLYVDDMLVTGDNTAMLHHFISLLSSEFAMKDLGFIHYFLGIELTRTNNGLHLSQAKYAMDLLDRAHITSCTSVSTPMVQKSTHQDTSPSFGDPTLFCSLVGGLQYLTMTRPDISFSVNYVSQFMASPTEANFHAVKRILHYISGTLSHGLQLQAHGSLDLYAYSDADWAGCLLTRRSTSGFCTFFRT
jgi:hypothetical protein